MKVKDLISKLDTFNPEYDIFCYCEDENLLPDNHGFMLFDIDDVEQTEAEKTRIEDGTPYLKLGKSQSSVPHILIQITSDF